MLFVQDRPFLHVDMAPRLALSGQFHIVADLALEADIANQAVVRFRVEPRQVARVRVAIGVAVGDVKDQDEIVSAGKGRHWVTSGVLLSCLRKKSLC